ncbi:MAG TPA: hypothetical protein VGF45_10655, partial [Polyangia bacterium]
MGKKPRDLSSRQSSRPFRESGLIGAALFVAFAGCGNASDSAPASSAGGNDPRGQATGSPGPSGTVAGTGGSS